MSIVKGTGDLLYLVGMVAYAAWMFHLAFPTAYHRLLAWLTEWYWRVRGIGDWYTWRAEWEGKMDAGE